MVGLVLLVWAFQKWNYGRSHQSTDNAQVDGHIVPVLAKVGGYVKTVNVNENDHVNAGQLLVQLDDADYRVRLQQAQADLAAAEATEWRRWILRPGAVTGSERHRSARHARRPDWSREGQRRQG